MMLSTKMKPPQYASFEKRLPQGTELKNWVNLMTLDSKMKNEAASTWFIQNSGCLKTHNSKTQDTTQK